MTDRHILREIQTAFAENNYCEIYKLISKLYNSTTCQKQCSRELLQCVKVLVQDLDLAECIHRLLQISSPTVVLDLCLFPGINDVHVLQAIFNMTYLPDKVVWLNRCLQHLPPSQLDFDLVEVDFWNGVLLQKGSFHLHISWASWIPLFMEHLMQSGCSRPKRWHWLSNSYCIADPDHVNLSLESIHLWKLYLFSPDSLLQCCRKVTRNSMKSLHTSAFDQLPLPESLVRYCRLDDMWTKKVAPLHTSNNTFKLGNVAPLPLLPFEECLQSRGYRELNIWNFYVLYCLLVSWWIQGISVW